MSKNQMTKERYLELREIAKKLFPKIQNSDLIDEKNCKEMVKSWDFLETDEEKTIIVNSILFPSDQEFMDNLKSCKNNLNALAKFYNCSFSLVMKKKAEIDLYYHYFFSDELTNSYDSTDVMQQAVHR